mmetsp:Transcript_5693/g.8941  ORF Transcript_5693/g.8941 Transcript_5693/m.8941 type:complete len:489 (+) Transcript_5693:104-1570(+)
MGCGASINDQNAIIPFTPYGDTPHSAGYPSELARLGIGLPQDEPPAIPDRHGIVLVSATRPDWKTADHLVFETKLADDVDEDIYCKKGHVLVLTEPGPTLPLQTCSKCNIHFEAGDTIGYCWECQHALCSKCYEEATESLFPKAGRFFSQRQKRVGTWRIKGNVLSLIWPLDGTQATVIAVKSPRVWINYKTKLQLRVLEPRPSNPQWFLPDIIAEKFQAESVASTAFECPVCYFELYMFPAAVIRSHSRRSCNHYFHRECAHYLLKSMKGSGRASTCPLCGAEFAEVKCMPDLATEPREWFACVDVDFSGSLDAFEVIEAFGTVLPVNRQKLEKNVKAHWHEWDPDGDGTIDLREFVQPGRGLRDWILSNLSLFLAEKMPDAMVPTLDKNPRQWFLYWDRNGNATLEKDEVIRAFLRTFCRDENGNPNLLGALDMREVATSLWSTMNYGAFDHVTFEEFVKPYGLMDQFMHNHIQCLYFGHDAELIA